MSGAAMHPPSPGTDDRREVFGWTVYAWAFHGFVTTVATVLFGPYLTSLAQAAVGANGPVFGPGLLAAVTAKSFFFHCVSLSVALQVAMLPLLGAIADYTSLKRRLLAFSSSLGAGSTCLLFWVGAGLDFRWGGALFVVANLGFGTSVVLYNAFLPEIASPGQRDRVSSRGYALGYLGGGVLLAANLAFMRVAPALGLSTGLALRLCLLSAGLWWGGFSLLTFRRLRTRRPARRILPGRSLLGVGFAELAATLRQVRGRPHTRRYLIAYLLYNDGIQTVISVAAVFLVQELFVGRGRTPDQSFLLGMMLMVQFVGFLGALAFERLAAWTRAKDALVLSLVLWSGVVVYGYRFLHTPAQAWWMSALIAVVLGGSQALSRSVFSQMIPPGREASFFALYEISASGTSWMGPFIFALVVAATSSYRQALLSLIVLFVAGTLLLAATDVERAFAEARGPEPGREHSGAPPRAAESPRGWLRRRLDHVVAGIARLAVRMFFREITVTGLEHLARDAPLLLVANHTNSVVDSFLLLALPRVRPRILAKSTLFPHPVMGPLLRLAGGLPVFRREDCGTDVARNSETFARCHAILSAGGCVALFPEGTSHNQEGRLPLKSGAARIVLGAEARRLLGVRVVPVGLRYEAKERFRSRVWVRIGEPIDPAAEVALYGEKPRVAVRALTRRIAAGLEGAVLRAEESSREQRPAPSPSSVARWRRGIMRMALPVLALGYALNWLPYRLPGWVSDRLSTTPDEPATYKLLAGLLAFPLVWLGEAAVALRLFGLAWGLAVAVAAPISGYAALRLSEASSDDLRS